MYNSNTSASLQQNKETTLNDFIVQQAPSDSISSIKYSPCEDILTACSWDGSVYIYAPSNPNSHETMSLKTSIPNPNGSPILCSCFSGDGRYLFTGSADGVIRAVDMTSGNMSELGSHSMAVSCMAFTNAMTLMSGSWDKTVKVWSISNLQAPPKELIMEDKVFAMDSKMNTVAILLSNNLVSYDVYTLEKIQTGGASGFGKMRTGVGMSYGGSTVQQSKYQVKSTWQLRSVACSNDGQDAIIGTTGSKSEIVGLRPSNAITTLYYSFRCKHTQGDRNVYPVNSVQFHPAFPHTMLTAGSDGVVILWNRQAKCRLAIAGPGVSGSDNAGITATAYNHTGRYLAIAVGYDWSQGYKAQISTPVEIRIVMIPEDTHNKTGMRAI
ncbi:mRNA export factor [Nematocida minor]|uniref:mRNA export factor n=1 Tax=Nematocida minor TaxID=1912983 RepID=UPI00221F4C24|nr:mRNA export factor [Nematocida minor]KAI5191221.1 mRNA export factor [Nematocida minor]